MHCTLRTGPPCQWTVTASVTVPCQLGRAMHEYKYLLPPHLRTAKLILAWRLPRKIAGIIVPFRYPRQLQPRTETDGDSTPLLAEAAAD